MMGEGTAKQENVKVEKLKPESINRLILDCITDNEEEGLLIPRSMTYTKDVYIDYGKLVDNKERVVNLIRQALPFFSTKPDNDFPYSYFQQTGEKGTNGQFKFWTTNEDDLSRFAFIAMYAGIIDAPKKVKMKLSSGTEREVLTHRILNHLRPLIVRE